MGYLITNVTGYFGGSQENFPEPCAENEDDFIRECRRLHIFRAEFRSYTVTKTRCLISFRSLNVPGLNCLWRGKGFLLLAWVSTCSTLHYFDGNGKFQWCFCSQKWNILSPQDDFGDFSVPCMGFSRETLL